MKTSLSLFFRSTGREWQQRRLIRRRPALIHSPAATMSATRDAVQLNRGDLSYWFNLFDWNVFILIGLNKLFYFQICFCDGWWFETICKNWNISQTISNRFGSKSKRSIHMDSNKRFWKNYFDLTLQFDDFIVQHYL